MRVSQYKCSLALGKIYRLNVSECIQVRFREGFFENRATFSHNLKPGGDRRENQTCTCVKVVNSVNVNFT